MRMSLKNVVSGKLDRPVRLTVYGPEGVGKSYLASKCPKPIFIGAEDGTSMLDIARFPEPKTFQDILDAVQTLIAEDHDFKTAVVDTVDWAEPLLWKHVCSTFSDDKGRKHDTIASYPYGQGYAAALDVWRGFLHKLDELRSKKNMHVVLLAHAHIRNFKNPLGEDYDRYELKLNAKASGLLKEWPDAVFFANFETLLHTEDNRAKGISSGKRVLYTERRAGFDAKNRFDMPPEISMDWETVWSYVSADRQKDAEEMIKMLKGDDKKKAQDAFKRAGTDNQKLTKLIDWMKGKL